MPTPRIAGPALTLLGTSLRGVRIGIGSPVSVAVVSSDGEAHAPVKNPPKMLIWDADGDYWTYAFLKNGRPKTDTKIGIAQRGRIVFYKVTTSTTRLLKFQLDPQQVFGQGTQASDYAKTLSFDAVLFDARDITWYQTLSLKTESAKSKLLDNDSLRAMFNGAQQLARRSHTQFRAEHPETAEADLLKAYSDAVKEHGSLNGKLDTYAALSSWLNSYEGDPRTVASLKRHLDREKEALQSSIQQAQKKLDGLKVKVHDMHPSLKSAALHLRLLGRRPCLL